MEINLTLPGEKFLIRLAELAAQAIGGVAAPMQLGRMARAQAEATRQNLLLDAQTKAELAQIRDGIARFVNGQIQVLPPPLLVPVARSAQLLEMAQVASNADTARRILNTAAILDKAKDEAGPTPDAEVSDKPVDPDWFIRWRLNAREVSDEEMQQVWAKVLAGEIKQPGSYSLRTLHFLSQMSKPEASFIEQMARLCLEDIIFRADRNVPFPHIQFSDLLRLEELGLIVGGSTGDSIHVEIQSIRPDIYSALLLGRGHILIFEKDDAQATLRVPAAKITSTFRELLNVIRVPSDPEHMKGVGKHLAAQGFKAKITRVTTVISGRVFWKDSDSEVLNP